MNYYSSIVATGSAAGELIIPNSYFAVNKLYKENGSGRLEAKEKTEEEIYAVTGINRRRWTERSPQHLGAKALENILKESYGEPELLIVAHNSKFRNIYSPIPAMSAVAQKTLQEPANPNTIAFDIITDCPDERVCADENSITLDDLVEIYADRGRSDVYISRTNELGLSLASPACLESGSSFEYGPDVIITQYSGWGTMAKRVKNKLGLKRTATLDVIAGCPGFTMALDVADRLIKNDVYKSIAVIGLDKLSAISDIDHLDSTLFADAAGGYLLEQSCEPGIVYSCFETYGELGDALRLDVSVQERLEREKNGADSALFGQKRKYLRMDGRKIFEFAVRQLPLFVNKLLEGAKLSLPDISTVYFHQMNSRIIQSVTKKLYNVQSDSELEKIMKEKVPVSLDEYGNSSVATIPLTFDLVRKGRLAGFDAKLGSGKYVMNVAVGAGLILGGNVIKL